MEKLTSLAALRAGDVEKIQKLEAELERAAAHRRSYEEKGKRYRDAVEEVSCGRVRRDGNTWTLCGKDERCRLFL